MAIPTTMPPRAVDVDAIERELAQLWRQPVRAGEAEQPITRACMSNLIIYCANDEEAGAVTQEIATIVQQHPSRVLLLVRSSSQPASDIEAYVSAHCHLAGGQQQICSEHITVSAGADSLRRLPSVARSLVIGDLPTALWWTPTDPPPAAGELFQELADMATQVIYDSAGWPDPVAGRIATAEWATSPNTKQIASDLVWRRLKPWKRLISQTLDPTLMPGALECITAVEIEHGPHALPLAWLLIGWAGCRLGWRPATGQITRDEEVSWEFHGSRGPVRATARRLPAAQPTIRSGSITWKTAQGSATARFFVTAPGRLGVAIGGAEVPVRSLAVPPQARAMLVAQQLPDRGRDALFRETLMLARHMAEVLLR
jgi:glucose-6-phosphate dehydrogenase assembly protein OpcA